MLFFIDANILIYTQDSTVELKRQAAITWLTELTARHLATTNLQVLNEVCHVALRKLRHLEPLAVRDWVHELRVLGDAPIDGAVWTAAWTFRTAFGFSWFDCLILSSADRLGCTHVLTEDMGADRRVGSLLLVNPFRSRPSDVLN